MNKPGMILMLVMVVIFSSFSSAYGQYSGGSGTEADPYQVATAADLIALGQNTGDYGKCFIMTADIDLAGYSFVKAVVAGDGVQDNTKYFMGDFDGNDHQITHLRIVDEKREYLGLFGVIGSGGKVRNIVLAETIVHGYMTVGGLCGENYGVINNCRIISTDSMIGGNAVVGGICGFNHGIITRCYVEGAVVGYNVGPFYNPQQYSACIGGLCGWNDPGVLYQCYVVGATNGAYVVAGFCAVNGGEIRQCYALGSVDGYKDGSGGLCAINNSLVAECYSAGKVTKGGLRQDLGGFCGRNNGTINNSFWDVSTSGFSYSAGGTGLKTAPMQDQATFTDAGWDFETIWHMPYQSTGYPLLWWQRDIPGDVAGGYGVDMGDYAAMSSGWMKPDGADMADLVEMVGNWLEGR